jgi:type 1 fimbriae regulatory protein FimB/type 1 fimbriae regulatory protein FimE
VSATVLHAMLNDRAIARSVAPHSCLRRRISGLLHVRRVKNGMPSVHPMRGSEIRDLRRLKREEIEGRHVFLTERRAPISTAGFRKMLARVGETGKFPFPVHPHMLRHACGYKLANDGQDTRAVQHYLGRKNIQHTVRYTEPIT